MISEDEASLVCLRSREKEDGNGLSQSTDVKDVICFLHLFPERKLARVVLQILLARFQLASLLVTPKIRRRQKATMILVVVLVEI
jgi:hypothetical protein